MIIHSMVMRKKGLGESRRQFLSHLKSTGPSMILEFPNSVSATHMASPILGINLAFLAYAIHLSWLSL